MSVKLRPENSTLLKLGSYNFTMEELSLIYSLYVDETFSLWEIKESEESNFDEASIEELAQAITHAQMDIQQIPYDQRPRHTYDPDFIDLTEFRVGNSRHNN